MPPKSHLSDHELLLQVAKDDSLAFDILYNRYWKRALSLATHKTGDIMEGENIVQDVFVSLWHRRKDLNLKGSFENYLFVSIKYRVIKVLNAQHARRTLGSVKAADVDVLDDSTQEYLQFEDLRKRLESLIGTLPVKSQLIYKLSKNEGMSYKSIATKLEITEKSVEAHLSRAKKVIIAGFHSYLSSYLL